MLAVGFFLVRFARPANKRTSYQDIFKSNSTLVQHHKYAGALMQLQFH
jgi:hypothetical protein